MGNVFRCYVEKKPGFAVEAEHLFGELRHTLGLTGLTGVRVLRRYDVEGVDAAVYAAARTTVLSEPQVDDLWDEVMPAPEGEHTLLAVEALPGQYDQRADSCAQCIQMMHGGERPTVRAATVYVLEGALTAPEAARARGYLINPVESREAALDKPATLRQDYPVPAAVPVLEGFTALDRAGLESVLAQYALAMDLADLAFLQAYFRDEEGRDPTLTEVRVVDTYWSDHCRHTTFSTHLDEVEIADDNVKAAYDRYLSARVEVYGAEKAARRPQTLMDIATLGAKTLKKRGLLPGLDESEEINACSIEVPVTVDGKTEQWLVQFKNETHNHPTEIEPFGGAATCLGGAIRDPLSGRAYVYQAMRVTGSGDPTTAFADTLEAKLPQRKITTGAAQGYSSYGNQIGLATGQVTELYDAGYVAKRMEIGAVIGASPKENVVRACPTPGDIIVLLGGRTGRDGCGGATGSSKAHNSESIETCGAEVQKGNPPTERKIQRLFRNKDVSTRIKRCNDFGAGGVCVAIGELADGLTVDLDKVPKKYEGLDGTELAISESQERMAVVLDPKDVDAFIAAAYKENLEATPVAVVTDNNRLEMTWRGDKIVDISRDFLNTNGVTQHATASIAPIDESKNYLHTVPAELQGLSLSAALKANLRRLEVCSQKGLVERFDSSIGAATVNMPYAGVYQLTPEEAMVAKLPLEHGQTDDATVMAYGFIPGVSRWSPFHSAAFAVTESLAKLAAVGCDPAEARLTFQEYFERLGNKPERWGKPAAALLGALTAQAGYGTPSIGGKDSMSGSFNELDVPPTLVSFAVGMSKASHTGTALLQHSGSKVYLLQIPVNEATGLPDYKNAMALMQAVCAGVQDKSVLSAAVVKEGGAAAAVCKMAFGSKLGFTFAQGLDAATLFAPYEGSFVVEIPEDGVLADSLAPYATALGTVNGNGIFILDGDVLTADELIAAWSSKLESVFPTDSGKSAAVEDVPLYKERSIFVSQNKVARPRVFIPAFPGTNCEVDTARAFEQAGADPHILVVGNLTPAAINETIEKMVEEIKQAQIVMLPGGFSGGDEPEGSGKFIATTFRNPAVAEAVTQLLNCRDGLMLGICNGFQALIKLGLVPYGKIVNIQENDPTLTFNTIGRHISQMAYTRVTSTKSPWLAGTQAGDMFAVPISHGEGRFVADEATLRRLAENGQIATQYVDPDGNVATDMPFNPNGSVWAVEGITSPDGRVLGKMGHCERKGENLYKNVPFNKDMQIFESGVKYFK